VAVTAIKALVNASPYNAYIKNLEHPDDTGGNGVALRIPSGAGPTPCNMWIPWADDEGTFAANHHIEVGFEPGTSQSANVYYIWQHGDYVRLSVNVGFINDAALIGGHPGVGGDWTLTIAEALDHGVKTISISLG
jgi:hypothetical protein